MNTPERMKMGRRALASAVLCALGCHRGEPAPSAQSAGPPVVARPPDAAQADNEIAGAVRGIPFTQVAAALVIESPESEDTTVIDLSSAPLACVDLSFSGWDRLVAAGTSILQLKVRGRVPGRYVAVLPLTLLSSREGTATWMRSDLPSRAMDAQGGWITIETISAHGSATGTFDLDFASGQLMGRFQATFCPNGHEP